jgi:hypothetical protein
MGGGLQFATTGRSGSSQHATSSATKLRVTENSEKPFVLLAHTVARRLPKHLAEQAEKRSTQQPLKLERFGALEVRSEGVAFS